MTDTVYIVAVKRTARNQVAPGWAKRIGHLQGVEVVGSGPVRAQVRANCSIEKLREQLGENFYVEPDISHQRLTGLKE